MAIYKNSVPYGNIVTDGLVLNLDAINPASYPGTGTTWFDTSGRGNNGTLTNGPVYTTQRGQASFTFNGTNNFTEFGTFNYNPGTTGELSLETWIYPTGPFSVYTSEPPVTNIGGVFGQAYLNSSIGWGISVYTISSTNYFLFQVRSGSVIAQAPTFGSTTPSVAFTLNNWYHVVGTFTRNELVRMYINNTLTTTGSSTALGNSNLNPSLNDARICRAGGGNFHSGARVSSARLYNRALSATEVAQNYNALKSRFGY